MTLPRKRRFIHHLSTLTVVVLLLGLIGTNTWQARAAEDPIAELPYFTPTPTESGDIAATPTAVLTDTTTSDDMSAQATCSANNNHLVPWVGGRWFLSGANVPWLNGGYGADFATVEEWNQHTYTSASTEQMFRTLRDSGANSVRWWVFNDGRGAPEFDSNSGGRVTGFDARFLPSMADAIRLAERYNIYLTFMLWDFHMLKPDGTPSSSGEHSGGHHAIIQDTATRQSFINNALIPMLRYPVPGTSFTIGNHPNVISWDIINEPEWGIRESGANNEVPNPVSLAEMQRFVSEVAGAIQRNSNQLVTVGSASMKWNSDRAPGAAGNWWSDAALTRFDPEGKLDYYQIHYYSWMNGDGSTWGYSPLNVSWSQAGFDKPVVVGEFPANASGSGMSLPDLLNRLRDNCYAGAWSWAFNGVDGNGSWADSQSAFANFNRANSAIVNIVRSGSQPPPPPPPGSTATPRPTPPPGSTATPRPTTQPRPAGQFRVHLPLVRR
ncbi:MAG: hypothetical protein MUD01_18855 [Chloroflexaceae bacterium]|nr:hypothetical protein [Chloroflexaceae bacterium]